MPSHYGLDARPSTRSLDFSTWFLPGDAHSCGRGQRLTPAELTGTVRFPVSCWQQGTYPDPENFNEDFAALNPELVEYLHERGVRLIGIDTPSVDLFDSKDLPSHRTFLRLDMAILEGLVLAGVPDGMYELVALPLKLAGFDASPVRAILRAI